MTQTPGSQRGPFDDAARDPADTSDLDAALARSRTIGRDGSLGDTSDLGDVRDAFAGDRAAGGVEPSFEEFGPAPSPSASGPEQHAEQRDVPAEAQGAPVEAHADHETSWFGDDEVAAGEQGEVPAVTEPNEHVAETTDLGNGAKATMIDSVLVEDVAVAERGESVDAGHTDAVTENAAEVQAAQEPESEPGNAERADEYHAPHAASDGAAGEESRDLADTANLSTFSAAALAGAAGAAGVATITGASDRGVEDDRGATGERHDESRALDVDADAGAAADTDADADADAEASPAEAPIGPSPTPAQHEGLSDGLEGPATAPEDADDSLDDGAAPVAVGAVGTAGAAGAATAAAAAPASSKTIEVDRTNRGGDDEFAPLRLSDEASIDTPTKPRKRSNRGAGVALALLGTLVFGALFLAAFTLLRVIYTESTDIVVAMLEFAPTAAFYVPVIAFGLFFVIWALISNRAGHWSYIIASLLAAAVGYLGYHLGVAAQLTFNTGGMTLVDPLKTVLDQAHLPAGLLAALCAVLTTQWFGGMIASRGRRVRDRNRRAQRDYASAVRESERSVPTAGERATNVAATSDAAARDAK